MIQSTRILKQAWGTGCFKEQKAFDEIKFVSYEVCDNTNYGAKRKASEDKAREAFNAELEKADIEQTLPEVQTEYDCSSEYWRGGVTAYNQWNTGRIFKDIFQNISAEEIEKLYPTLHEAAEDKFVDVVNSIIERKTTITKLQELRKNCGYSQRELAEKSGVNRRTLQQYELKAEEINKAVTTTLLALSKTSDARLRICWRMYKNCIISRYIMNKGRKLILLCVGFTLIVVLAPIIINELYQLNKCYLFLLHCPGVIP